MQHSAAAKSAFESALRAHGVTVHEDSNVCPERHCYPRWSCVEVCRNTREQHMLARDYAQHIVASYAAAGGGALEARHVTAWRCGKEYTLAARVHHAKSCVYCK